MYVGVCMCVYMSLCMHVYVHIYVGVCEYMCMYIENGWLIFNVYLKMNKNFDHKRKRIEVIVQNDNKVNKFS